MKKKISSLSRNQFLKKKINLIKFFLFNIECFFPSTDSNNATKKTVNRLAKGITWKLYGKVILTKWNLCFQTL